jgi:hypothetical protein
MVVIVRHFEKPRFCYGEGGLISFDNQIMVHRMGMVCDQSYRIIGPVLKIFEYRTDECVRLKR